MQNLAANSHDIERYCNLLTESKRRALARKSAIAFTNAIDVPGKPVEAYPDGWEDMPIEATVPPHHFLILDTLQRISEGEHIVDGEHVRNCMLFMPPGSAKSTYASSVFPAWYLGANPQKQIILASYGSDLARKHGKKARQICGSGKYRNIFDTGISADTRAADEWALETGSEYMSGGLLSGLTGNRADGLIIDDPVKGKQEARSEKTQVSTQEAYQFDADTRLKPNGWKCIIQTRWDERDLAGTILPDDWSGDSGVIRCKDGELWDIICIQAECEREDDPLGRKIGEHLWPEWFPEKHWNRFKRIPSLWRALCQQVPTAEEGTYFQRAWFNMYKTAPEHLVTFITLDSAESQDEGDFTFMIVWGVAPDKKIYVLNMWRGQVTTDVWVDQLIRFIDHYKPSYLAPEDDNIFKAVKPFLKRRMLDEGVYCAIKAMPHGSKAKPVRAQAFQGLSAMGLVHLPEDHAATEILLDQLVKFDAGRYDDGVDACSAFGRLIDKVWQKQPPEPEPEEVVIGTEDLVLENFAPPLSTPDDGW